MVAPIKDPLGIEIKVLLLEDIVWPRGRKRGALKFVGSWLAAASQTCKVTPT